MTDFSRRDALRVGLLAGISFQLPRVAFAATPLLSGRFALVKAPPPTKPPAFWQETARDLNVTLHVKNITQATLELTGQEGFGNRVGVEITDVQGQTRTVLEPLMDLKQAMTRAMPRPVWKPLKADEELLVRTWRVTLPEGGEAAAARLDVVAQVYLRDASQELSIEGLSLGKTLG
jgi:hypothetical protein